MKSNFKTALISGGLAVAMGAGIFIGQALAAQPRMQSALDALLTARSELNAATANKGGHRVKALGYVDQAITEVRAGIEFAE